MKPTRTDHLFGGAASLYAFGREFGDLVTRGKTPEDAEEHNHGCLSVVDQLSHQYECRIYAPVPGFNAQTITRHTLTYEWIPGRYFRGHPEDDTRRADGLVLRRPKDAYGLMPAGCPIVVLRGKKSGTVVCCHSGLKSLFDFNRHVLGKPPREFESVINSAMAALKQAGDTSESVHAHIGMSIGPTGFAYPLDHVKFGANNKKLRDSIVDSYGTDAAPGKDDLGQINLPEIIRVQLEILGVPGYTFDGVSTSSDVDENDELIWHTVGAIGETRNFVLVVKNK